MTINNVSTYGSLQSLLQNIGSVQGDLSTAQQQISSGQVSQNFQGLGSNTEQYTAFTAQMSRLTDFAQSNTTVLSQMQATNNSLTQITSIANSVNSLISAQSSGSATTASFTQQMQSAMAALSSALNTTYGNSYLFGGTSTNTAPIKSSIPAPTTPGTVDASYYQGSNTDVTVRVADNQTITPGIRADNTAFQQLYAGIQQALAAVSGSNGSNANQSLASAEALVQQGIQGVVAVQATVNANIVNVQSINTENSSTQTYLKGLIANISSADVVSLSTQVAQDQSVLEATYSTYGRISSLSLVSYLPAA